MYSRILGIGFCRVISIPIGIAVSVILARTLGVDEFGKYSFLLSIVSVGALPLAGGLQQFVTKSVAMYSQANEYHLYFGFLRLSYIWTGIIFVFTTTTALFSILNIEAIDGISWEWVVLAGLLIPFVGLNAIKDGIAKGLGKPLHTEVSIQLFQPLIILTSLILLSKTISLGVREALMVQLFSVVVAFGLASICISKIQLRYKGSSSYPGGLWHWIKGLFPFMGIAAISTLNLEIAFILSGSIAEAKSVSALRIADRSAQLIALSLMIVNMIISPYIVEYYKERRFFEIQRLSQKLCRLAFSLSLFLGCILFIYGKKILSFFYGEEFSIISYVPMVILIAAQLINVFVGSVGQILSMTGFEKDALMSQVVSLVFNVVLCIILIPRFGEVGAAIAVAASIVVWNSLMAYRVYVRLGIRTSCI